MVFGGLIIIPKYQKLLTHKELVKRVRCGDMELGYTYNDGGRGKAGYRGEARDCVCRAIAILTESPYEEVYQRISEFNRKLGRPASARNGVTWKQVPKLLELFGFERMKLPPVKPTYREAYYTFGDCLVSTTKHVAALKDGLLQDIVDGREYDYFDATHERKARSVYVLRRCRHGASSEKRRMLHD